MINGTISLQAAIARVQQNDLNGACAILQDLVKQTPQDLDSTRLLAKILLARGDAAAALPLMQQVAKAAAGAAEIAFELGVIHLGMQQFNEALDAFDQELARNPNHPGALYNKAWALRRLGRDQEAVAPLRALVSANSTHTDGWYNLGNLLADLGENAAARDALTIALNANPADPRVLVNLGAVQMRLDQVGSAEGHFRTALKLAPDLADAQAGLGRVHQLRGDGEDAVRCFEAAWKADPNNPDHATNYILALREHRAPETALAQAETALRLCPGAPGLLNAKATIQMDLKDLTGAEASLKACLQANPRSADALGNLGNIYGQMGRHTLAIDHLQKAHGLAPDNAALHSNLLFLLSHAPDTTPESLRAEHRQFGELQEALVTPMPLPRPTAAEANKRLRIGYVSPDFRDHAVFRFFEPVLDHHDRDTVAIYCYPTNSFEDACTRKARDLADAWRPIAQMSPDAAAALIREDQIDILVDLAGHTARNGLPIFARKPAPIQCSWIGYPATTGLSRMDYVLGVGPERARDFVETPVPLTPAVPFRPPENTPAVTPPPHLKTGHITFGSLNKSMKINEAVLDAWAKILAAVDRARLLIVLRNGEDAAQRQALAQRFTDRGIDADRLEIVPEMPFVDYAKLFARVDIALDSFPYGAGTTACMMLWMGVPLVTTDRMENSASLAPNLLKAAGVPDLIAPSSEAYVEIAVALAQDPDRLEALRADLRARALLTPVFDEAAQVRSLERAYRQMWQRYVTESASDSPPSTPPR
ncbi:MAG: tetratricopeptide repeat protein [Magnetospiraceae bacterium]